MASIQKIAILGFGREGRAVLRFLQNRGLAEIETLVSADKKNKNKKIRENSRKNQRLSASAEIWVLDKNPTIKIPGGLKKQIGKNYLKNLEQFNIVFRSPGIPYNLPEIQNAKKHGATISSGTKLFFKAISGQILNSHAYRQAGKFQISKIIGVTGTKGKGTTCTLLYKILKAHSTDSGQAGGRRVFLAGNIGKPAMEILSKTRINADRENPRGSAPVVILELSSFQLQDLNMSPQIAAVLDIFPDHQDSHANLTEYYNAKANIARYQSAGDKIFYFPDNPKSAWIAGKSRGKKIGVVPEKFKLFSPEDLKMPGYHNFKNAVMAANIACSLGVPEKIILRVVKKFHGTEHRLELVRTLKIANQSRKVFANIRELNSRKIREIQFYNDSSSTNPHTVAAAVRAFSSSTKKLQPTSYKLILIAGGKDKNLDYSPLAKALKNSPTKLVVLIGENRKKIATALARTKNNELRIKMVKNLQTALSLAYAATKKYLIHNSKFIILFSPGAASFDMFHDYADRGRQFKELVNRL